MNAGQNDFGYTEEVGGSYLRFNRIIIDNPIVGVPTITAVAERVFNLSGNKTVAAEGVVQFEFDPEYTFSPLHPITNLPVGEDMSMVQLYMGISGCVQKKASVEETDVNTGENLNGE